MVDLRGDGGEGGVDGLVCVTSSGTKRATVPSTARAAAAALPRSGSRAPRYTVQPSRPSWCAASRPSPLFAPVMSTLSMHQRWARTAAPGQGHRSLGSAIPARSQTAGAMLETMDRPGLAAALKAHRARLSPADVGLAAGLHRRVPGLRREEVALLAGISVDYLIRLEQGRGPTPSAAVLASLARALRVSDDERHHLFNLAGSALPRPGHIITVPRSSTLRLLDRITDLPALLLDAKGDILAWNSLAASLLGDFSGWPLGQRNIVWQRFLGSGGRVALDPDEDERTAAEAVAALRAVAGRYPDDPGSPCVPRSDGERRRGEATEHDLMTEQYRTRGSPKIAGAIPAVVASWTASSTSTDGAHFDRHCSIRSVEGFRPWP